tara:strand:+ start:404 stop:739 length:336 start_codon:yes stop_codon:yes gene_type:complete
MDTDIINWLIINDKISKYNNKCKELKELRKEYQEKIINDLDNMETEFTIEKIKIKVRVAKINKYSNFSDKYLLEKFNEYFNDKEISEELLKYLKDNRKCDKKYMLKKEILD